MSQTTQTNFSKLQYHGSVEQRFEQINLNEMQPESRVAWMILIEKVLSLAFALFMARLWFRVQLPVFHSIAKVKYVGHRFVLSFASGILFNPKSVKSLTKWEIYSVSKYVALSFVLSKRNAKTIFLILQSVFIYKVF